MKAFIKKYWDESLMYLLSLSACLMANQWEAFKESTSIKIDLSLGRIGFAIIIATLSTALLELIITDPEGTKRAGKRKKINMVKRIIFSILFGLASPQAVDIMMGVLTTTLSSVKIGG